MQARQRGGSFFLAASESGIPTCEGWATPFVVVLVAFVAVLVAFAEVAAVVASEVVLERVCGVAAAAVSSCALTAARVLR